MHVLWGVLVLLAVAGGAYGWHRLSLWAYPNRSSCWFCKGSGSFPGSKRKKHGPCPVCKGKPKRRRGVREK